MRIRVTVATGALVASMSACGSSGGGAPPGAVVDCGEITSVGSFYPGGATARQTAAQCYVAAVHACHAARLELNFRGVDTGTAEVLTVRRASGGTCVTSMATTSNVLTQTTHRHQVCRVASVVAGGLDLEDCHPGR